MNASPGGWHLTPKSREMVPLLVQRPRLSSPVSCFSPEPRWSPPICQESVEVPPGCRTVQGLLRLEAPRRPIGASHLLRLRAREQQGATASPVWDKSRHRAPVSPTSTLTTSGHTTCLSVPRTLAFGPGCCSLSLLAPGLERLLGPRPASRSTLSNVFRSPPGRKTLLFVACYLHVFGFLAIFYLDIFGTCR